MTSTTDSLRKTSLHGLHVSLGARMVPFAGYDMPVQFTDGILKEHLHTREAAGLFDVSHMGQAVLRSDGDVAGALETLVPADIKGLAPGQMRYTQLLNDQGGILDDLMVTRPADPDLQDTLFLVVNAACKDADFALIESALDGVATLRRLDDRSLIALQGPQAAAVLSRLAPSVATMPFMSAAAMTIGGIEAMVSRAGYTGEDGYEISIPDADGDAFARQLLDQPEVAAIGLGARDSLRLEAGLCLYGHDIDETTTPIEAALTWSVGKRRREEGGFPGAAVIQRQLAEGVSRRRVGLLPEGRAPAREGAAITDTDGNEIGQVTSGGFGPSLGGPMAMGYVAVAHAKAETPVNLIVRGKALPARVAKMPFVPQRYYRG